MWEYVDFSVYGVYGFPFNLLRLTLAIAVVVLGIDPASGRTRSRGTLAWVGEHRSEPGANLSRFL